MHPAIASKRSSGALHAGPSRRNCTGAKHSGSSEIRSSALRRGFWAHRDWDPVAAAAVVDDDDDDEEEEEEEEAAVIVETREEGVGALRHRAGSFAAMAARRRESCAALFAQAPRKKTLGRGCPALKRLYSAEIAATPWWSATNSVGRSSIPRTLLQSRPPFLCSAWISAQIPSMSHTLALWL